MNHGMNERLNAADASGANLFAAAALSEHLGGPHFVFDFECMGPRESQRAELIGLREAIESERALSLVEGFDALRLISLQLDLAAIPLVRKWRDGYVNTIMTAGKNDLLDKYFAGSSYTAAWYLGLISSASYSAISAADTPASHAGWTEGTGYSQSTRVALTFSSASGGSKATSSASSYSINATDTIKGGFVTTLSTKSGTTGILYSAGLFTGGDRSVLSGDTLNASLTQSV
jgi:hypothetical protein